MNTKEYQKQYQKSLAGKKAMYKYLHSEKGRAKQKENNRKLKLLVLNKYGGKCACCGESYVEFLAIDHIGGGGNKHRKLIGRKGRGFYFWLRTNKFPRGYRVLCHNCNQSIGYYGYCPHQIAKAGGDII